MVSIKRDDVLVNYDKWALADTLREVREGFPLIRDIKGSVVSAYLSYMSTLPPDRQLRVARLLIDRRKAYRAGARSLIEEEEKDIEQMFLYVKSHANIIHDKWMTSKRGSGLAINSRKLSREIRAHLTDVCGEPDKTTSGSWFHSRYFDDWQLLTWVEVRKSEIRYHHTFFDQDHEPIPDMLDVMRWMGVNETKWDLLAPGDEEQARGQLVTLCEHFVKAVPAILGL